jgi:hypothetical protein
MITYLMKEDNELFFCDAENDAEAREAAAMYGGVVVRRATQEEIDATKENNNDDT